MKQFKNSLLVTSDYPELIEAAEKALNEVGYKTVDIFDKESNMLVAFSGGEIQIGNNIVSEKTAIKLSLPSQWHELKRLAAELKEEEFKVGDWVVCLSGSSSFTEGKLYKVRELKDSIGNLGIEKDDAGSSTNGKTHRYWRLASDSEIESHLIKEAEKKGFVKGAKIKNWTGVEVIITGFRYANKSYSFGYNALFVKDNTGAESHISSVELLPSTPQITIAKRSVEFFDNHIKLGCQTISAESILRLHAAHKQWDNTNKGAPISQINIQGEIIDGTIIEEIANHYQSK
jgi:hypothetical protein